MKIILTETVQGLGEAGTIQEVADGYARNYLLPKRLAVPATRGSVKQAEAQAEMYARKASKAREETQRAAAAVEGKTVTIRARVGSENRLYGSVTPADVAEALMSQHGISLDRRKIELAETIHRIGTYTATADFGNGVTARFSVEVAPEAAAAVGSAARATGAQAQATTSSGNGDEGSPTDAIEEPVQPVPMDTAISDQLVNNQPVSEEAAEEEAEANPT